MSSASGTRCSAEPAIKARQRTRAAAERRRTSLNSNVSVSAGDRAQNRHQVCVCVRKGQWGPTVDAVRATALGKVLADEGRWVGCSQNTQRRPVIKAPLPLHQYPLRWRPSMRRDAAIAGGWRCRGRFISPLPRVRPASRDGSHLGTARARGWRSRLRAESLSTRWRWGADGYRGEVAGESSGLAPTHRVAAAWRGPRSRDRPVGLSYLRHRHGQHTVSTPSSNDSAPSCQESDALWQALPDVVLPCCDRRRGAWTCGWPRLLPRRRPLSRHSRERLQRDFVHGPGLSRHRDRHKPPPCPPTPTEATTRASERGHVSVARACVCVKARA
eukprot:SAG11_NODE_1674_length_4478_cov_2.341631_7_plen_329_part_00